MDINDIKKFLADTKDSEDTKAFIQGLYSVDTVQTYLTTNPDGKKIMDSANDKFFQKAHGTWETNNLPKLKEQWLAEQNPNLTPEQLKLKQLENEISEMKNAKNHAELKTKALTAATQKKLPIGDIIDMFVGKDEDTTMSNISKIDEVYNKSVQSAVEERLKSDSYIPPKQSGNVSSAKDLKSALGELYK